MGVARVRIPPGGDWTTVAEALAEVTGQPELVRAGVEAGEVVVDDGVPGSRGLVVDATTGDRLGTHAGSFGFTVGQRRGLNLQRAAADGANSVVISAQIESEIAVLDDEEQKEFLETLGLEEPGLNRLIREAYKLLGLQTYFTVGPKEARAWTINKGDTAPKAAGVIHTDFEKGFIKAEIVSFADLDEAGTMAAAKSAGKVRMEGKDYVMADGDVVEFRFNV